MTATRVRIWETSNGAFRIVRCRLEGSTMMLQSNAPRHGWTQNFADAALYATRSTAENAARHDGFEIVAD